MTIKRLKLIAVLWAAVAALVWFMLLTSCKVLKSKETRRTDSTFMEKDSSGSVKKTNTESHVDWEWWKTTLQYQQQQKIDTTINNFYTNNPKPQVIIMEGGKGKEQVSTLTVDSSWKNAFRSLALTVEQSIKSKETETVTPKHLLLFGVGIIVAQMLLSIIKGALSKFQIIKRS